MPQENINIGTPNGNDGEFVREAFDKTNNNFTELYTVSAKFRRTTDQADPNSSTQANAFLAEFPNQQLFWIVDISGGAQQQYEYDHANNTWVISNKTFTHGVVETNGNVRLGGTIPSGDDVVITLAADLGSGGPRPDATTLSLLNVNGEGLVLTNNNVSLTGTSLSLRSEDGNTNINTQGDFNLFVEDLNTPDTFRPHVQALRSGSTLLNAYENQNILLTVPSTGGIVFNVGGSVTTGQIWTAVDNTGRGTWQDAPTGGSITVDSSLSDISTNPVENRVVDDVIKRTTIQNSDDITSSTPFVSSTYRVHNSILTTNDASTVTFDSNVIMVSGNGGIRYILIENTVLTSSFYSRYFSTQNQLVYLKGTRLGTNVATTSIPYRETSFYGTVNTTPTTVLSNVPSTYTEFTISGTSFRLGGHIATGTETPRVTMDLVRVSSTLVTEEGTFTPTITATGATYTVGSATGQFTRVGNLVFITIFLSSITQVGTATGATTIGGLPFDTDNHNHFGKIAFLVNSNFDNSNLTITNNVGVNTLAFSQQDISPSPPVSINFTGTGNMVFSYLYRRENN